jgi:hypothetical protein
MNTTPNTMIPRQVSCFPPIGGGKYHAVSILDGDQIAICQAMVLDRTIPPIVLTPLTERVPAMVCKRCLVRVAGGER